MRLKPWITRSLSILRRFATKYAGYFLIASNSLLLCQHGFSAHRLWNAITILFVVASFFYLLKKSFDSLQRQATNWLNAEFVLLGTSLVLVAIERGGGYDNQIYALLYAAVATVATLRGAKFALVALGYALIIEVFSDHVAQQPIDWSSVVLHAAIGTAFALLSHFLTRAKLWKKQRELEQNFADYRTRIQQETRLFRLSSGGSLPPAADQIIYQSSVEEVHHALYHTLQLLQQSLGLYSCVLLMLSEDEKSLIVTESVSEHNQIERGPFVVGAGIIGACVQQKVTTHMERVPSDYTGILYYDTPVTIGTFVAVPVIEKNHLRGVLCADRVHSKPFQKQELQLLENATSQILRSLENERVFVQLERSKREQNILYEASQRLGAALSQDDVFETGVQAISKIVRQDFVALSDFDEATHRHRVRFVKGALAEQIKGLTFNDNSSLVAMSIKNRHYLPYRGDFDPERQTLFTSEVILEGMHSLLVIPLVVRDQAIGTLIMAARQSQVFSDSIRATLFVLANQLGTAWANAVAVKKLEEMATTDGLTGCLNKRTFLDALERRLQAARRFNRSLSLIVTDIDHFKGINDQYGHATGDRVIQQLAKILHSVTRDTDLVGRFGGEEFCILCEETDTDGAVQFAERIREKLATTLLHSDTGMFQVTASMGVATFPQHAQSAEQLFEVSDKALFVAKRSGRNRVKAA